jgi:DNA-directed RNA polymerase sigma subunit (sigma70/sigma32)
MSTEKVLSADFTLRLPYHVPSVIVKISARARQLAQGGDGCQAKKKEASNKLTETNAQIPFCLQRADKLLCWKI